MAENPYKSPTTAGHQIARLDRPPRLASRFLTLGFACCLVSWIAAILYFPFGELIHHIDVWGTLAVRVIYWIAVWTAFLGPIPTAIALWKGSIVVRFWGVFVLLLQVPLFLKIGSWLLQKTLSWL